MSKIAEKKALEAYPIDIIPDEDTLGFTSSDRNEVIRLGYTKGYDQAMQDFLEKALRYLEPTFKSIVGYNCGGDLTNDFQNYMKNESEN